MVGSDHQLAAAGLNGGDNFAKAAVNRFDRRNCCGDHAGMANHVGVGEVDDRELRLLFIPSGNKLVGRALGAHLRALVVGRDFTIGGNELAPLAALRVLVAAGKEVGDVRVLLSFSYVELAAADRGNQLRQSDQRAFRLESDGVRPTLLVLGQAAVISYRRRATAINVGEGRVAERARNLAHSVGAEVERNNTVAWLDCGRLTNHGRGDELVGFAALVGGAGGVDGARLVVLAAAVSEQVVGGLNARPALIAVHRVVAADHTGDSGVASRLAPVADGGQVILAAVWVAVATIGEGVYKNLADAKVAGHADQRLEVFDAGVDATITD